MSRIRYVCARHRCKLKMRASSPPHSAPDLFGATCSLPLISTSSRSLRAREAGAAVGPVPAVFRACAEAAAGLGISKWAVRVGPNQGTARWQVRRFTARSFIRPVGRFPPSIALCVPKTLAAPKPPPPPPQRRCQPSFALLPTNSFARPPSPRRCYGRSMLW